MSPVQVSAFQSAVAVVLLGAGGLLVSSGLEAVASPLLDAPVVDARSISEFAPEALVLAEGRIDEKAELLEPGLALAQWEIARGVSKPGSNDVRFTWEFEATRVQSFTLVTAAGPVIVDGSAATLEAPTRSPAAEGVVTAGTRRVVGFAPGDEVTVEGAVRAAGAGVTARRIVGGTAEALRDGVRRSARVPFVLGAGFAIAGLLALVFAVRSWRLHESGSGA